MLLLVRESDLKLVETIAPERSEGERITQS